MSPSRCPALSVTVTDAVAALPAAAGVPMITPVTSSISSPAGRSADAYDAMSACVLSGAASAISTPTCSASGAA